MATRWHKLCAYILLQEKLNEAVMVLNKNLQVCYLHGESLRRPLMQVPLEQEINIQNMNVELVAQMFKNYRSNVLFHLEGNHFTTNSPRQERTLIKSVCSNRQPTGTFIDMR